VPASPAQPPARVIVADDHSEIRDLLSLFLPTRAGHPALQVVATAADGQEAVERTRELTPEAIVLDLSMPRMDGLEAARVLRAEHPGLVIVVYSGFEASEFASRALECGADQYVEKGARGMEQVAQALQQLLGEGRDAPLP
jgi:CheY-like chemotaxis protein